MAIANSQTSNYFKHHLRQMPTLSDQPPSPAPSTVPAAAGQSHVQRPYDPLLAACVPTPCPAEFGHGRVPELAQHGAVAYIRNQQLGGFRATQLLSKMYGRLASRQRRRARRLFLQATFGDAPVGGMVSQRDVQYATVPAATGARPMAVATMMSGPVVPPPPQAESPLLLSIGEDKPCGGQRPALRGCQLAKPATVASTIVVGFDCGMLPASSQLLPPPPPLGPQSPAQRASKPAAPPKPTLLLRTGPNNSSYWLGGVAGAASAATGDAGATALLFSAPSSASSLGAGSFTMSPVENTNSYTTAPTTATTTAAASVASLSVGNSFRESLKMSLPRSGSSCLLLDSSSSSGAPAQTLPISIVNKANIDKRSNSLAGLFGSRKGRLPGRDQSATTTTAAAAEASSIKPNQAKGCAVRVHVDSRSDVNDMMKVYQGPPGTNPKPNPTTSGGKLKLQQRRRRPAVSVSFGDDSFFPTRDLRRGSKDSAVSETASDNDSTDREDGHTVQDDQKNGSESLGMPGSSHASSSSTGISHGASAGLSLERKHDGDGGFYLFPLSATKQASPSAYAYTPAFFSSPLPVPGAHSAAPSVSQSPSPSSLSSQHSNVRKVSSDLALLCKSPEIFLLSNQDSSTNLQQLQQQQQQQPRRMIMILSEEDSEFLDQVEATTYALLQVEIFGDTRGSSSTGETSNDPGSLSRFQWLTEWQRIRGMKQDHAESLFALYMRSLYSEILDGQRSSSKEVQEEEKEDEGEYHFEARPQSERRDPEQPAPAASSPQAPAAA